MLIQPDKTKLGDGQLCFREAMIKAHAEDQKFLERYRLDNHEDMKNMVARAGRRMHHSELMRKVLTLEPAIVVEQQINFPDDLGFYIADVGGVKRYLSSFHKGWSREFSYVLVDHQDLPCEEIRGWRTILFRLLGAGVLSWEQVRKTFGDPTGSSDAKDRWFRMTFPFRCEAMQRKIPI